MRRRRRTAQELRGAIDCLPHDTRVAMLEGIRTNAIIVGAYTDRNGGVCPMLAAHRCGGRTSLASFARAWDRYTGAPARPRDATERELRTLKAMLEISILDDSGQSDLAAAVADLKTARARRAAVVEGNGGPPRRDAGERENGGRENGGRDRTEELRTRPGWAWLRPFRRYDDYSAALEEVREAEREVRRLRRERDRELEKV
jgi:hypothetical protein